MPELVPEGPRIPVHLMNEVDEGSVVFFCGAGVSVGDGDGWRLRGGGRNAIAPGKAADADAVGPGAGAGGPGSPSRSCGRSSIHSRPRTFLPS